MANLDKKEIIDKISSKVDDKDLQMELLEDITDSFEGKAETIDKKLYDELKVENDIWKKKYDDLQNKYISRFQDVSAPPIVDKGNDEIEEKKVIDIKSIF